LIYRLILFDLYNFSFDHLFIFLLLLIYVNLAWFHRQGLD